MSEKIIRKNINNFTHTGNEIFYTQESSIYTFNLRTKENDLLFESEEKLQEIYFRNDMAFTNTIHGDGILIANDEVHFLKGFNIRDVLGDHELLCFHDKKTVIYDFANQTIKSFMQDKAFKYYLDSRQIFYAVENSIKSCDLTNSEFLWEFDVSELGKFIPNFRTEYELGKATKIVGTYRNQIIASITAQKIIGLDVDSGRLLWVKDSIDLNSTNDSSITSLQGNNRILDQQNGLIHIFQGKFFTTLNIDTQKTEVKWYSEKKVYIRQASILDNCKILFTAHRPENAGNDDMVGVFDIKRNSIIWHHVLDFEKGGFIPYSRTAILAHENNIFVLDFQGNLYVIESNAL